VDPSSLIFLAIIAIWAAYLLGHWVRRRDQLATARSIDRFSESMRVLERRTPTRPVAAARPTARAYVVAPVRAPASRPAGRPLTGGGRRPPAGLRAAALAARSSRPGLTPGGEVTSSTSHHRITRAAARRRARLVLVLGAATAVAWLLAAATAVVWWPAALVSGVLLAVLVQLRRTVRAASSAPAARSSARRSTGSVRSASPRRSRRSRGLAARVPAPARRPRRHQQDARAVLQQLGAMRAGASHRSAAGDETNPVDGAPAAFVPATPDVTPNRPGVGSGHDRAGAARQPADPDGGWQPVPVPPPTYTLKPKARPAVRRPVAEPGATGAAGSDAPARTSAPSHADVPATNQPDPTFDLDEILERRIAAGG
jgi:hypothetical protein